MYNSNSWDNFNEVTYHVVNKIINSFDRNKGSINDFNYNILRMVWETN